MKIAAVILAGGKGSRMKTDLPKALVELNGKPLIEYSIDNILNVGIKDIFIVYSRFSELLKTRYSYNFCLQKEPLGSGDALKSSLDSIKEYDACLVLSADMPLIKARSVELLIEKFTKLDLSACYMTSIAENPTGYGRVIKENGLVKIVEEADVDDSNRYVKEVNVATYIFKVCDLLKHIDKLNTNNVKNEYLITDLAYVLSSEGLKVDTCLIEDFNEFVGVNDLENLEEARHLMEEKC